MSGEINDQTEQYQRGQVLGFTMAEIMLVLIFLLLLLLGTQLQQTQDKLESAYAPDSSRGRGKNFVSGLQELSMRPPKGEDLAPDVRRDLNM